MRFQDRAHAGRELARLLKDAIPQPCVVGAVPRGGVAVGLPVAETLEAPLVVVNAHKLTAPIAPEFAFGAIDEDGEVLLDRASVLDLGLDADDVERARQRAWEQMRPRIERPREGRLASWLPRAVVLVDDGLATGLTMQAGVRYARRNGATEITVAVPCSSREAAQRMRLDVERFVCPVVDPRFVAVGHYYVDFSQLSDGEMAALLARADQGSGPTQSSGGHPGREG
jgi:predicted phosphoribosyltransferase